MYLIVATGNKLHGLWLLEREFFSFFVARTVGISVFFTLVTINSNEILCQEVEASLYSTYCMVEMDSYTLQ